MTRLASIALWLLALCGAALAQFPNKTGAPDYSIPTSTPGGYTGYRQLLDAANAQLAQTVATYEAKIADLNAQIKNLTEDKKAPDSAQPGSTSK